MIKKIVLIFFSTMSVLLFISCASIVSKSAYPVSINSTPSKSDITITDDNNSEIYAGTTPTVVTLPTSHGYFDGIDYKILFKKEGYGNYIVNLERGVDGWYILGNIAFGGLIGWFIVDPATGAMWTLPSNINPNFSHMKMEEAKADGSPMLVTAAIPLSKELTDRVNKFLFLYCQTYENKDFDKFSAFFTPIATENGKAIQEVLPEYRKNIETYESFSYRIELDSLSQMSEFGKVRIKGRYFAQFMKEGNLNKISNTISMEVIENGDSYLITQLNYPIRLDETEVKQPEWGPWQKAEDKE